MVFSILWSKIWKYPSVSEFLMKLNFDTMQLLRSEPKTTGNDSKNELPEKKQVISSLFGHVLHHSKDLTPDEVR